MKTLKRVLVICLVALSALFVSCPSPDSGNDKPIVEEIIGYTYNTEKQKFEVCPFKNGGSEVTQQLARIDIKFDRPMNMKNDFWTHWSNSYIYIYNYYWTNDFTYTIVLNKLYYESYFKVVLNDFDYINQNPDTYDTFSDTEGNELSSYPLVFTVESGDTVHPLVKEIDVGDYYAEDALVDLQYNEYGDPPNLQTFIILTNVLSPYPLKAGDTLKLKYKIRSDFDLPPISVNLVDTSSAVNYWRLFTEEKNFALTDTPVTASTEENPVYVEKELTFVLIHDMSLADPKNAITVQFTCFADDCDPENDSVQFYIGSNRKER